MIDNINRKIISELRRDGRTSNIKLARELGINVATVARRIDAMLQAVQYGMRVNITGVKNRVNTAESFKHLRRECFLFPGNVGI